MTDIVSTLAARLAEPDQPDTLFRALEQATAELVGHQLFTLLYVDGDEVARVYSNRPEEYPVSGRKPMGPTPWGDLVMTRQQPFLGRNSEDIRWAFFDHALIASMGLASVINIPVIYNGEVIGTMNLLDAENAYTDEHVAKVARLAPLLIPAYLAARFAVRAKDL